MEPNDPNKYSEPLKQPPEEEPTLAAETSTEASVNQQPVVVTDPEPGRFSLRAKIMLIIFAVLIVAAAIIFYLAWHNSRTANVKNIPSNSNTVLLAPAAVSITSNGFAPATLTIEVNQAVIWTNEDTAQHEVASDPYPTDNGLAGFNDKQPLNKNDTYNFVFNKAGTYTYHDNLNPNKIGGTIIVKK